MSTWHITILFQAPRGAVITDSTVEKIHNARPEFSCVSHLMGNQLEFTADVDSNDSTQLYATAYRRAAEVSTDVLGYPVEFLRSEVVLYDHWLEQIDPGGAVRAWAEEPSTSTAKGNEYTTSNTVTLTEEFLQQLADEAEKGYPLSLGADGRLHVGLTAFPCVGRQEFHEMGEKGTTCVACGFKEAYCVGRIEDGDGGWEDCGDTAYWMGIRSVGAEPEPFCNRCAQHVTLIPPVPRTLQ